MLDSSVVTSTVGTDFRYLSTPDFSFRVAMATAFARLVRAGVVVGAAAGGVSLLLGEGSHRRRVEREGQRGGHHHHNHHHPLPAHPAAKVATNAFAELDPATNPVPRDGILATIGNTPLVEARSLSAATGSRILLKMEDRNPGGSVKDRPALFMIELLEKRGLLKPGVSTIVEGTGGNTGIGLALVAKAKGLRVKVTMPNHIAEEKISLMRALGAEVILCPGVPFEDQRHYFHVASRIAQDNENHFFTNQFESLANGASHYYTTGPEIWRQSGESLALRWLIERGRSRGRSDAWVCAPHARVREVSEPCFA